MLVSLLYICAQGASSGARVVKVYFWMYSLRSERLAVGARQLWRQHVIVARRPDRPKNGLANRDKLLHLHLLALAECLHFKLVVINQQTRQQFLEQF